MEKMDGKYYGTRIPGDVQEQIDRLAEIERNKILPDDPEMQHRLADEVLLEIIKCFNADVYQTVSRLYINIPKWYA